MWTPTRGKLYYPGKSPYSDPTAIVATGTYTPFFKANLIDRTKSRSNQLWKRQLLRRIQPSFPLLLTSGRTDKGELLEWAPYRC